MVNLDLFHQYIIDINKKDINTEDCILAFVAKNSAKTTSENNQYYFQKVQKRGFCDIIRVKLWQITI